MAGVRIDNMSDDSITIHFNSQEYVLADEESVTVSGIEKGKYILRVHRTRVPRVTADTHNNTEKVFSINTDSVDQSVHTQLDGIFEIEINSVKAVITVRKDILAVEKFVTDALFSGYSLNVTGAKELSKSKSFANDAVKKKFIKHQLKNAFLPIGIGGIVFLLLGIMALVSNLSGKTMEFSSHEFTMPWAIGLLAVGLACFVYVAVVIIKTVTTVRKFK